MITLQTALERLKRLGYAKGNRVRIYGQEFDLLTDPIAVNEGLVFVDGVERKTGEKRRVRIPLPIIRMIFHETGAG